MILRFFRSAASRRGATGLAFLLAALVTLCVGCAKIETTGRQDLPRIISHVPSVTEILFALDLGDQVVGVTDFCRYPPEALDKPKIGGMLNPNIERAVSLRPDVVIIQREQRDLVDRYARLGIETLAVPTRSVDDVLDSIRSIGNRFDRAEKAEALVDGIRATFDELREATAGREPVPTLVVIGHEPGSLKGLFVAAKSSFHDQLLTIAGGANVVDSPANLYPALNKDAVVQSSPRAILELANDPAMSDDERRARIELWNALPSVEAVRRGGVRVLSDSDIMIPGPRMGLAARRFFEALKDIEKETTP